MINIRPARKPAGSSSRARRTAVHIGLGVAVLASSSRLAHADERLTVFPPSPQSTLGGDWDFTGSMAFDPSGSQWTPSFGEQTVFLGVLKHSQRNPTQQLVPSRSWEIRLGRGGQIYSMRSAFGEGVAPQFRPDDGDRAPWVDEVWQMVGVSTSKHSPDAGAHYFVHQAGVYLTDPILKKPFFSPPLVAEVSGTDKAFRSVHWGQQASIPTIHQSHLLYYQLTRDIGAGIVEVTQVAYNFGDHEVDRFNAPWGGTRRTSLDFLYRSNADGSKTVVTDKFSPSLPMHFGALGGWVAFSAGQAPNSLALGLVFGKDPAPLDPIQWSTSLWKGGYAGGNPTGNETDWRNYLASSVIRRVAIAPGTAFFVRYYYVFGSLSAVESLSATHDLVSKAGLGSVAFSTSKAPLLGWSMAKNNGQTVLTRAGQHDPAEFFTFAHPVKHSKPLFRLRSTGREAVSVDPYTFSARPYDGATEYQELLGFVLPADQLDSTHVYQNLSSLFSADPQHYRPTNKQMFAVIKPKPDAGAPPDDGGGATADAGQPVDASHTQDAASPKLSPSGEESGSGCGCRQAPRKSGSSSFFILFGLIAAGLRRISRSRSERRSARRPTAAMVDIPPFSFMSLPRSGDVPDVDLSPKRSGGSRRPETLSDLKDGMPP